jgi:CxxC motif-containing protein (DUF1111 family)
MAKKPGLMTFRVGICTAAGVLAVVTGCSGDIATKSPPAGGPGSGNSVISGGNGGAAGGGGPGGGISGPGPVVDPGLGGGNPITGPMIPPSDMCGGAVPGAYISNCSGCHTQNGAVNSRYPDLFEFKGTFADFQKQVRSGSTNMAAYPPEIIGDGDLMALYAYFIGSKRTGLDAVNLGGVSPLFVMGDAKNPPVVFKRDDGVLVTRGAGRVRGRHEKEGSYGTFGSHYFEDRTYGFIVEDFTPAGKNEMRVTYLPIAMPDMNGNRITNWRAWKVQGNNATFAENKYMTNVTESPMTPTGKTAAIQQIVETTAPGGRSMSVGENYEFEFGVFIAPATMTSKGTRDSYYTDTFRYRIGTGGLTANNRDYVALPGPQPNAQLGGDTTIVWAVAEPETYFSQMALNTQHENVQNWVEGRRLFHTDFATGAHSEPGNPVFTEQAGKAGPLFATTACVNCHDHNGPGALLQGALGPTSSMVFKLYDAGALGNQLQLQEGTASMTGFETKAVAMGDGTTVMLKRPTFTVSTKGGQALAHYSARLARKLIGMGLLEAIDERTILARADRLDCDKDGISGRPSYIIEPKTNVLRLGRMGWKAEKSSVMHQVADAAEADLGVGTSLIPDSTGKVELSDAELIKLTTYMRLVGVPPQRDGENADIRHGEQLFKTVGCAKCHVTDVLTGANHPFSELRGQSIRPFTDLLLHDMGPELADNSGIAYQEKVDAPASASEWRTPPLWGIGLYQVVNGHTGLLHDGRAANVTEAVLWHGGEATAVKSRFTALSAADRASLLAFVMSL